MPIKADPSDHTVQQHFENRNPEVRAIYDAIIDAARRLGPVREEAKKTSIHLVRNTAFAGVATRKAALVLTLKSESDISSKRIVRRQQTSANRWHVEVKLESPDEVNRELIGWLKTAYSLSA
jgi:hypothetical protein